MAARRVIRTVDEACALLGELHAPARLITHARLVSEAAALLLAKLAQMHVTVDRDRVIAGAALHDAGKIVHPEELDRPGAAHEPAGERLLLAHGVDARVARSCLSHAQWASMECSVEELLVALADKLWKGVRHSELETRVIDAVATALGRERWDLFIELDARFESIAADGTGRLQRSR